MAAENQEYREQPIFGPVDDLRTEVKRLKLEVDILEEALALAVGDIEAFGKIQARPTAPQAELDLFPTRQ